MAKRKVTSRRSSSGRSAKSTRTGARSAPASPTTTRSSRGAPARATRKTAAPPNKRGNATRSAAQAKVAKRKTAARAAASQAVVPGPPAPKPSRLAAAVTLARGAAAGAVAAMSQRLPWATDENDPIVLLETDHRRFEDLLKRRRRPLSAE